MDRGLARLPPQSRHNSPQGCGFAHCVFPKSTAEDGPSIADNANIMHHIRKVCPRLGIMAVLNFRECLKFAKNVQVVFSVIRVVFQKLACYSHKERALLPLAF